MNKQTYVPWFIEEYDALNQDQHVCSGKLRQSLLCKVEVLDQVPLKPSRLNPALLSEQASGVTPNSLAQVACHHGEGN